MCAQPTRNQATTRRVFLPKLVVSDLDGTLLHSDGNAGYGTLSERSIQAVQAYRAAGGQFVIATGNPPEVVQPLAAQRYRA